MESHVAVAIDDEQPAALPEAAGARARVERALALATQATLALFVLAAPHSIAVAQGAFLLGCVFWVARMVAARRFLFARTAIDIPLALFVGWTLLSVSTSLDPAYSLRKMRGVALFFVFYLFATNVTSKRFAWALTLLLAVSSTGNLWWTYAERLAGRGVEVTSMAPGAPLGKWGIRPGDTILEAGGRPVGDLATLDAAFASGRGGDPVAIRFRRGENEMVTSYRRSRVWRAGEGPERLGVGVAPGREFRARAFFSHPATYAETLQLIGAVAAAWVMAAAARRRWRWAAGMGALALLVAGALVQTQTRAPIAAFGLAVVAMALLRGASRRALVAAVVAAALLVAVAGGVVLRGRSVSMLAPTDDSTSWRLTVWREGASLVARYPLLGIGPDAAKTRARELDLYDHGKLPPGHFHSTPLQIAVDRGLPALAAWLALLAALFVALGRLVGRLAARESEGGDWRVTAAALGAWGGWVGFAASSTVHFNWGDSEPMQMAWALAGIAFAVAALDRAGEGAGELR